VAVLVIGANGQAGGEVARLLAGRGVSVRALFFFQNLLQVAPLVAASGVLPNTIVRRRSRA